MQKVTIMCDHCDKELERGEYISMNIEVTHRPYSSREYENERLDVDLCPECKRKMLEFMNKKHDYFEQTR